MFKEKQEKIVLGYPKAQNLYHPQFEHDACGIGCITQIDGLKSHSIVADALLVLRRLAHRGGAGSIEENGDGAGILTQIPDAFFRSVELGFELPEVGRYGVGMVFLPRKKTDRVQIQEKIEKLIAEEGQICLGWRYVPVQEAVLSQSARENRPHVKQVFVQASANTSNVAFERLLYVIRKRCEHLTKDGHESDDNYFYFSSLSTKTIVYKGMLTAEQVDGFYLDLQDLNYTSAIALVHSRYSTNTFPSWERAHPYRMLIHNGEINTLRGNLNRMKGRQNSMVNDVFGDNMQRLLPIVFDNGSDSSIFDNTLEFLVEAGIPLAQAIMMMIPEPWENKKLSDDLKAFYAFSQLHMEAWDGPAAMVITDGNNVVATLDRNGLRPSRYLLTKDNRLIISSEIGVLDIQPSDILESGQVKPGELLYVDTIKKAFIRNDEIKAEIASLKPYKEWLKNQQLHISQLKDCPLEPEIINPLKWQKAFGYTLEERINILLPMAKDGKENIASMGHDGPLAILSRSDQNLFAYFKQTFAQVTNPPIDALRESMMMSTQMDLGPIGNLLDVKESDARRLKLDSPMLNHDEFAKILKCSCKQEGLQAIRLDALFTEKTAEGLENALEDLFNQADQAIELGHSLIILSDRNWDENHYPIPSLLALSGLHQHLTRSGTRTKVSLIVESAEAKETHHFALLIGFGASAIYPYLALDLVKKFVEDGQLKELSVEKAQENYLKASLQGIVKIMSKMGISTLQSYQGAQIFEALGVSNKLIEKYFTNTISRIGGIDLEDIVASVSKRIEKSSTEEAIDAGSLFRFKKGGEAHIFNPETIRGLQQAVMNNDYELFKKVTDELNDPNFGPVNLRSLMGFKETKRVPLEEVESVDLIVRRFKTGAMSYGSISPEAHESLAIAMNRLRAKSNTGEGGEDPVRYTDIGYDSRNSAIKQIASGRFGVTSEYLSNAQEIQIKMAQGAKPGEGGQLPGMKVYPWIAKARNSTLGVTLISPPPHHDIYSIEDLAQLIHDMKNANSSAKVSVKLVSENGVGTIAAGVAKGRVDGILISGHEGGTGASPLSSIQHAGLPWELGLAETHQTLMLNNLRSRIKLETDGKLVSGRDVVIAALLGAEEFGFATAPLIALGCVMARVCHLDTCPMGIATQNPERRKKFIGKPEYVVNFMIFIAQEVREIMAELGFRTINEMVGQTQVLKQVDFRNKIDLSAILSNTEAEYGHISPNHSLNKSFDQKVLIPYFKQSLFKGLAQRASFSINNVNRTFGTQLGHEITKRHGGKGLPENHFIIDLKGVAGQSFGAFIPSGITLNLEGYANDYCGKGLSGGSIIVKRFSDLNYKAESNSIIGNVAFFGATSGEGYINGCAGERFAVRNSGAKLIVEGIGNHGCEYMTNGEVIVLGQYGYNFAAGMSGGIAYVYDPLKQIQQKANTDMVDLFETSLDEKAYLKQRLSKHIEKTDSVIAKEILSNWNTNAKAFIKVYPKELHSIHLKIEEKIKTGLSYQVAQLEVFNESVK